MSVFDLNVFDDLERNPKWRKRYGEKEVIDWKKVFREHPELKKYEASPKLRNQMKNSYYRIKDSPNYLKGYDAEDQFVRRVPYREVFGKTPGRASFSALLDENRRLQILGKTLRGNAHRLMWPYNIKNRRLLLDLWKWSNKLLREEMKGWTPRDRKLARWHYEWQDSLGKPEKEPIRRQKGMEITAEEYRKKYGYFPSQHLGHDQRGDQLRISPHPSSKKNSRNTSLPRNTVSKRQNTEHR